MEENVKVDKVYLRAFNLGYELAKELDLKLPMFKALNSENSQMRSLEAGMAEYYKEIKQANEKTIDISPNLESSDSLLRNKNSKEDKGKGFDLSL